MRFFDQTAFLPYLKGTIKVVKTFEKLLTKTIPSAKHEHNITQLAQKSSMICLLFEFENNNFSNRFSIIRTLHLG